MTQIYSEVGGNLVAVQEVPREQTSRYGVLDVETDNGLLVRAKGVVEKPSPDKAPSTLAISGRYILSPEVFKELNKQKTGVSGEIQLTDAIASTLSRVPMHGIRYEGRRFDCGNKIGFLMANIEFALDRPDIASEFKEAIKTLNI